MQPNFQQRTENLENILRNDLERKTHLKELYDDIEHFMKDESLDPILKEELTTEFEDVVSKVKTLREELMQEECPIVVTGETSAGKSSLINLLLGNDILPESVLANTSTICRLWNKEKKAIYVVDENDERRDLNLPPDMDATVIVKELQKCFADADKSQYKAVDIHWPIPFLQKQALIVDTPGIGSSDELTRRLEDYLPNAIACIYVINTSNAGGVQKDRLLQIFETQMKCNKHGFDPTRVIFVCNKWDQIGQKEEEKVWDYIAQKLQETWPNFQLKQMFKFSALKEQARASTPGLKLSESFQELLEGINAMIPAVLEAKTTRHASWQRRFLEQLLNRIVGRIRLSRLDNDKKEKRKNFIEEKIKRFQNDLREVKDKVMKEAKQICETLSEKLSAHLSSDKTRDKICDRLTEVSFDGDTEAIEYELKNRFVRNMTTEIMTWFKSNNENDLTKRLTNLFKRECQKLDYQSNEINDALIDISKPLDEIVISDYDSLSDNLKSKPLFSRYSVFKFAIWDILSIGCKCLVDFCKRMKCEKMLDNLKEWHQKYLTLYNTNVIYGAIKDTYLADFNSKVQDVCENLISHQKEADKKFINNIKNELRSSCDIRNQYLPMERSCKCLLGKLLLIDMDYFSGHKLLKENIRNYGVDEIGKGQFSDVHSAEVFVDGSWTKAAVKTLRRPLDETESYVQLSEVHHLRTLSHQNIVELYGVSYRIGSKDNKFLQIYMEFCDNSLEDVVFRKRNPPPCYSFKNVSECKESWEFYLKMMCDVCSGLDYIHSNGFVHRDLKLANILIKGDEAKIADVGLLKEVDNILGTAEGTLITMAPEVMSGKSYDTKADIYSFGIVLWEMWYARPAYTIPTGNKSDEYQFIAKNVNELSYHISNGTRPDFETKHRPGHALQVLMRKCWNGKVNERPKALKVLEELEHMKSS